MKRLFGVWLLWAATLLCGQLRAEELKIRGRVHCAGEGLQGVWVSDGERFAQTDKRGNYRIESDTECDFLFVCLPAGYEAPVEQGVVRHFKPIGEVEKGRCDFELQRRPHDDTRHTLIATADPQIWAQKEFSLLGRGVEDIRQTVEAAGRSVCHGICLGDIVFNDHGFYEEYNHTMARAGIPFRNIVGNHDMSLYIRSHEGSTHHYGKVYGPAWYSFDVGKVHYVVLNDNFYIGRDWYYIAYLEERQLRWLEEDLSHQKPGQTVILSMHIPSTCTPEDRGAFTYARSEAALVNYKALYELLAPFNAHILSGHTHTAYNSAVRDNLYDHVIPALSGAWWQGELCTDGTPAGYAVFEVDGDTLSWYYKSVGHEADHQMRLYTEADAPEFAGYVVANIWNSDPAWQVEFFFDGRKQACAPERFEAIDPAARKLYSNKEGLDHSWIGPTPSDHFYRCPIGEGVRMVEVRATDRFGRTYTQQLILE